MKKVLVLSVVAIAIFAVASFAGLTWSGGGYVQYSYSASPSNFSITPTTWWLQVTESGTGYSYTANLNPYSISSFYFTLNLMKDLSLITGVDTNMGEGTFGGSAFNGPSEQINGSFGGFGIGYGTGNLGLQYNSSAFNVYAQSNVSMTNGTLTPNLALYADAKVGPATVYGGADGEFANYYAGANATVGPLNLYGLFNQAATTTNFLVEAVASMGNVSVGAGYAHAASAASYWTNWGVLNSSVPMVAWVDLGNNLELNAQFANGFALNKVTVKGYTTLVGTVQGELDLSYSPTSGMGATAYLLTDF
ncbi:MAG: hypothetical protein ACP5UJ_06200 [Athalassotoga sp.]|uniref:hypothetical protein n=1 Tax=Athalassotoga sp. TaxID=2022597 RepID=UPI003CFDFA17